MLPSSSLHYVYHHCTVTEGVLVVALLAEVLTLRMSFVRGGEGFGLCSGWPCALQGSPLILVGQRGDGDQEDGTTSLLHIRRMKANRSSSGRDLSTGEQDGAEDEQRI